MVKKHEPSVKTEQDYLDYVYSKKRLDEKIKAFTEFTLPSIASQTHIPFKWYVFYSKQLPKKYKEQLNQAVKQYSYIDLILVKNNNDMQKYIKDHSPKNPYITVRIDDDDALAPNYLDILSKQYKPNLIISPIHGYKLSNYNFQTQVGRVSHFSYKKNIGAASALSYTDNNVFSLGDHTKIYKTHKNILFLKTPGVFIRLINHSNLSKPTHTKGASIRSFSFKRFLQSRKNKTMKKSRKSLTKTRKRLV